MIDPTVLKELLSLGHRSQSNMQIDRFVIARNGMTPFGVLKQAHREMADRWDTLKKMWMRLVEIEAEILKVAAGSFDFVRAKMQQESLREGFEDTARTFLRCYAHGEWARAMVIKEHGSLNPAVLERLDLAEWVLQLRRKLALEMRQVGHISESTLDQISVLPKVERDALFACADLGSREMQWNWLKSYDFPQPESGPPQIDVGQLELAIEADVNECLSLSPPSPIDTESPRPTLHGLRLMPPQSNEVPV